jgi:hypothetical protein
MDRVGKSAFWLPKLQGRDGQYVIASEVTIPQADAAGAFLSPEKRQQRFLRRA